MPLSLSVADDFNQDARLDLVVIAFPGFDLFLGTGDGSFQLPASAIAKGSVGNAVDFNGDGKLDLVAFSATALLWLGESMRRSNKRLAGKWR
jgi:hypothetical protein